MEQSTEAVPVSRPMGRPSKYKPTYCEEVIDFMARGYSLTAWAGNIGVGHETAYGWAREIPEFSEAVKIARAKRLEYLERGILDVDTPGPAVTARIFALKNAGPHEWRGDQTGPYAQAALMIDDRPVDGDERELARRVALMLTWSAGENAG